MAPEALRGEKLTLKCDVYSYGVVGLNRKATVSYTIRYAGNWCPEETSLEDVDL